MGLFRNVFIYCNGREYVPVRAALFGHFVWAARSSPRVIRPFT